MSFSECEKEIINESDISSDSREQLGEVATPENKKASKKFIVGIIAAVATVIFAISVYLIIPYINPTRQYLSLIERGKIDEADTFYEKRIAGDDTLVKKLTEAQNAKVQEIYDGYVSNTITFDDAKEKLSPYKQSVVTQVKANTVQNSIDSLKKSREAYETGAKAEANGDIENALKNYKAVIESDDNFKKAAAKVKELGDKWKTEQIAEANNFANDKQYNAAISVINKIATQLGRDAELTELLDKFSTMKSEQYVKVECVEKSVTPKNISNWIFSNYVNFVFEITNNSDKPIKGVEGALTAKDLFGKEIITLGCDFTGHTIEVGETYRETGLGLECNEFIDSDMQLYSTDYSDLQFEYEIYSIVYADGTTVVPN